MKKFTLSIIVLFSILFLGVKLFLVPQAQKNIKDYFTQAGFKNTQLNHVKINIDGISVKQITLDADGFNTASDVETKINWLSGTLQSIKIKTLNISSIINTPKDILIYKHHLKANKQTALFGQDISIENITWDIATPTSALRLTGYLHSSNKENTLKASLSAKQRELSFDSKWTIKLDKDDNLSFSGNYNEFNIHTNSLKIKRGTGWIHHDTKKTALQFDAGNGGLLGMPLSNISLVMDQKDKDFPAILRAKASGLENTKLYGDFNFSQTKSKQLFDVFFETPNKKEFISHLNNLDILPEKLSTQTLNNNDISLYIQYVPENRFADGPFPFTLKTREQGQETAQGNFLIYPNKLDVRGSAQGKNSAISFLKSLLLIENNEKSGNDGDSFRFEKNLKDIL